MLCQICRRGHLMAFINDCTSSDSYLTQALHILGHRAPEQTQANGKGQLIPLDVYNLLFEFVTFSFPTTTFQHFKNLPHPIDSYVLPPFAIPVHHITYKGRNFSTFKMHPGNSSISFHACNGTQWYYQCWFHQRNVETSSAWEITNLHHCFPPPISFR
jgi:hypothetical protein